MMKNNIKISSRFTYFYKRIFPMLWFGFLLLFLITSVLNNAPLPLFIIPCVMVVFGYSLFKKLCFDLMDEVYDCGDSLLIKNNHQQDNVDLKDISNVNYLFSTNPTKVTLSVRADTKFGNQISFAAPTKFMPFTMHPLIKDLIDRVDKTRNIPRG